MKNTLYVIFALSMFLLISCDLFEWEERSSGFHVFFASGETLRAIPFDEIDGEFLNGCAQKLLHNVQIDGELSIMKEGSTLLLVPEEEGVQILAFSKTGGFENRGFVEVASPVKAKLFDEGVTVLTSEGLLLLCKGGSCTEIKNGVKDFDVYQKALLVLGTDERLYCCFSDRECISGYEMEGKALKVLDSGMLYILKDDGIATFMIISFESCGLEEGSPVELENARYMDVNGDTMVVLVDASAMIYDISDPSSPVYKNSLDLFENVKRVKIKDGRINFIRYGTLISCDLDGNCASCGAGYDDNSLLEVGEEW